MTTPTERPKPTRIGRGTIVALAFVACFWMLVTLGAVLRSRVVGWSGLLRDEGALTPWVISLALLSIVLIYRDEIIKPSTTTCPKCGEPARRGQFRGVAVPPGRLLLSHRAAIAARWPSAE